MFALVSLVFLLKNPVTSCQTKAEVVGTVSVDWLGHVKVELVYIHQHLQAQPVFLAVDTVSGYT